MMSLHTVRLTVNSTWRDLEAERQAVEKILRPLREMKFIDLEYSESGGATAADALPDQNRQEIYLGIWSRRDGSGTSMEAEYQRAQLRQIPCFLYYQAGPASAGASPCEPETGASPPQLFVDGPRENAGGAFTSPDDLARQVATDLHHWLFVHFYVPEAPQAALPEFPQARLDAMLTDVRAMGTRSVALHTNYGTVLTGDLIFQILGNAPLAFTQVLRTEQFRTRVMQTTERFVGRKSVFQAIDQRLQQGATFPSGYVLLYGEPGIGKTALLSQLVRLRGYLYHFNDSTANIRSTKDFLGNICAQLIIRYKLDYEALPVTATQDSGFLSQLLVAAVQKAKGSPIVILVDALDEAADSPLDDQANRLLLPRSLPDGVFFVISTRNKSSYRLTVDRLTEIELSDASYDNRADISSYIEEFIRDHREPMLRRLGEWKTDEGKFIAVLAEKSEGNFMYLVHILPQIRDLGLVVFQLKSIDELPRGLNEYYHRHWSLMQSLNKERFHEDLEPVICILAIAREAVPQEQLIAWTKEKWPHLNGGKIASALEAWREFLNRDRSSDGVDRYRIYHKSFQDFLGEKVGLDSYNQEIAFTALRKIPGFFPT